MRRHAAVRMSPSVTPPSAANHAALESLAVARWRIGLGLTVAMTAIYVVFILLVAYGKTFLGTLIAPGLSIGIALGVLVILSAWALILVYVRWANAHYDHEVAAIRRGRRS
jgi:uncharacterized membrane protein (DUF485 family)